MDNLTMLKVLDMIDDKNMEDTVSISSFVYLLEPFKTTAFFNGVSLVYKFNEYEFIGYYDDQTNHYYATYDADTIMVASDVVRKSLVTVCHRENKTVGVYTSTTQSENAKFFSYLENIGVDFVVTTSPELTPS